MSNIKATGTIPNTYEDLFIFVPSERQIIGISEGTGDNLLPEDEKEGYVDYIYYQAWNLDGDMTEADGGQVMLKELFRESYNRTADCIPAVLDMMYDNNQIPCFILCE